MPATTNRVFLDATYLIALAMPRDQHHAAAVRFMEQIVDRRVQMVTTRAVLLEVANFLAQPKTRSFVVSALEDCEHDPLIEILPFSEELYAKAFALYRSRSDKSWGLTDCASFIVMREHAIAEALTADEHFEQAGFVALLNQ
jgi:Predicted nucleic acid-binding protein, contains PIN domain